MGRILAGSVFAFTLALLTLSGCTGQGASAPDAGAAPVAAAPVPAVAEVPPVVADVPVANDTALRDKSKPGAVDYSCSTDADCAIKDVGNCCGTYPACVNSDSPTFPEQVKAQCAESGMSSICGFPVLSGCQCVDNRCEGVSDGQGAPAGRID